MNTAIELWDISKHYGRSCALNGVTLKLEQGKFYILLGKNGAGKSTLMKILMRYETPDHGGGRVLGRALDSDTDDFNRSIGYVSEALDYMLPMPMGKLFGYFAELYPTWDQKCFDGILSQLRIDLEKHFRELSRGQKMQVAFAAALAIRPKLLILDEITAVLDANARGFFMDYLGHYVREGGTVIMATNIVSEVQNHANHMILLHDGKVSLDVPVTELSTMFVKLRRRPGLCHEVFEMNGCIEVALNSDGSTSHIVKRTALNGLEPPVELADHRGITAEEIFIYFTRSGAR